MFQFGEDGLDKNCITLRLADCSQDRRNLFQDHIQGITVSES